MTAVHEATVEVLTAEVRVLMVGSRQITMSVAEQLDSIKPEGIEPFGRIRRRPHCRIFYGGRIIPDCPHDCLDVIGRSRATGALVRSCARWGSDFLTTSGEWDSLPLIALAGLR